MTFLFTPPPGLPLLAALIARQEGFGVPGAIPTVRHNPGDLRHSPHSWHPTEDPDGIGYIDNDADGWADLVRQLGLDAARSLSLGELIGGWAPAEDGNDPAAYLADLIAGFAAGGVTVAGCTPVAEALKEGCTAEAA